MIICRGNSVCGGIAMGKIHLWKKSLPVEATKGRDPEQEWRRFQEACRTAVRELVILEEKAAREVGEADALVFEAHRMMAEDPGFSDAVKEVLQKESVNAEYAAYFAGEQLAEQLESLEDSYWKARAADIRDVAGRVVRILKGEDCQCLPEGPCILLAQDLTPSETIQMEKRSLLGVVTSGGSVHSHTAILARSRNLPALVGVEMELDENWEGLSAAVDGERGLLYLDPDPEVLEELALRKAELSRKEEELAAWFGKKSETKDGRQVRICANISGLDDLDLTVVLDADGIGLFRSEFLYLEASDWPSEEAQFAVYKSAAERMAGKRVIIRTVDIGADKQPDYFSMEPEENPALGCRGIRFSLCHPEIFRTQLRAILRAAAYGKISILYPMITSPEELGQVLAFTTQVKKELDTEHVLTGEVEQGIMIETPSAVLLGDRLAEMVDFFSIGTNDLTQYTLAADRQNSLVQDLVPAGLPAVLRMIQMTARSAANQGIWVGICGDLAADTGLTEDFLRMGIEELSVAPHSVWKLRKRVGEISLDPI
ncbi:phosphoenolpyruvate--protein phosphotransferase [Cuneatibacter sp. NSJ-177]|uniref:phosphoenolpyruvate--protein phosphotransferase n=1 Tax=Cuneatibacter sp. NSJ-177 TaxID=2931401 RepID=UPI001FD4481C|nr:phosphoenolpyruvate--protein phosphotransferase [Cuneatibacter sp. NSJ-177]MCJ7834263.1 phosphoenolpyruvate--protein phosphotransferase [Cuneatibacter sp. NSJ-177]